MNNKIAENGARSARGRARARAYKKARATRHERRCAASRWSSCASRSAAKSRELLAPRFLDARSVRGGSEVKTRLRGERLDFEVDQGERNNAEATYFEGFLGGKGNVLGGVLESSEGGSIEVLQP